MLISFGKTTPPMNRQWRRRLDPVASKAAQFLQSSFPPDNPPGRDGYTRDSREPAVHDYKGQDLAETHSVGRQQRTVSSIVVVVI